MSGPPSANRRFVCDGCQAVLPYDPAQAGKPCRCGKCGKSLLIPNLDEQNDKPSQPEPPKFVELWCRVCDTRLVAKSEDSGKKAKCTDCGAVNVIPTPRKPEAPRVPAAMQGPQYDVWEVDKAPEPEKQRVAQPKLFPIYCRVCGTLMYAELKHVGGKLKCPDCGALTAVKEPPKEVEKKSPLVPDGEEYKLSAPPPTRQKVVPEYIERIKQEGQVAVAKEAEKLAAERPKMPPLPTLNGVLSMLVREPVITWWVGLSVGGTVVAWLLINSIPTASASGFAQMFALMCRIFGFLTGLMWYGPTAAILCAIVAESSEGHTKLYASPSPRFFECLMEMLHIGTTLSLSCIPGFAVMKFVPWEYSFAVGGGSFLIFFPVLLLSTFHQNTPMGIFSLRVWGSLVLRPAHWLLFYVESAIILAIGIAASMAILVMAREWLLGIVPVALATAFVYCRVLGRFAWWLAESLPVKEKPEIEPRYKRFA